MRKGALGHAYQCRSLLTDRPIDIVHGSKLLRTQETASSLSFLIHHHHHQVLPLKAQLLISFAVKDMTFVWGRPSCQVANRGT